MIVSSQTEHQLESYIQVDYYFVGIAVNFMASSIIYVPVVYIPVIEFEFHSIDFEITVGTVNSTFPIPAMQEYLFFKVVSS
jgi:hypothetical protein